MLKLELLHLVQLIDQDTLTKSSRPQYKSLRKLVKETEFTGTPHRKDYYDYYYYVCEPNQKTKLQRSNPKYPTLDFNEDDNFNKYDTDNIINGFWDNNSTTTAFDNKCLSKIRKYIYRYRTMPSESYVYNFQNCLRNGPCGDSLQELAEENHLNNFQEYSNSHQMANNFFAWRCWFYLDEALKYQRKQFKWNKLSFEKDVSVLKMLIEKNVISELTDIIIQYVQPIRRMKTSCPKIKFMYIDGTIKSYFSVN